MLGVEFRALCFIRGKFHLMDGTCLVGSDDPQRIHNAVKWYLYEEKQAELIKLIKYEPF